MEFWLGTLEVPLYVIAALSVLAMILVRRRMKVGRKRQILLLAILLVGAILGATTMGFVETGRGYVFSTDFVRAMIFETVIIIGLQL